MPEVFALVDCNNFFASCERSFNPKLIDKPVVILSNNDGCVIARSNEAKSLGIPMGSPAHEYKEMFKDKNVFVLSSNFSLYGDISNRVMKILSKYTPEQEIYSIDESFLRLSNLNISNFEEYCLQIVKDVKQSVGIPISVGIGPTKTLAKIANKFAKKNYDLIQGIKSFNNPEEIDICLKQTPVISVWGIGYKTARFLNKNGIYTALDFKNTQEDWIRQNLTVSGSRIQMELKGIPCLEVLDASEPKKGILSSRSFRNAVSNFEDMKEAVSTYTARASEKLRDEESLASAVTVWVATNWHKTDQKQYFNSSTLKLPYPTSFTPDLIKTALKCLEEIYLDGYFYKKASVYLSGLIPKEYSQYNLYESNPLKKQNLMEALDYINYKQGHDSLSFASQGTIQRWKMKQENTSPNYTLNWDELVVVK